MRTFHFRLESVLEVRRHQEDMQKQVLSQKLNQLDLSQRQLQELFGKRQQHFARIRELQMGQLNIRELEVSGDYVLVLEEEIANQELKVRFCEEQVELARAELLEIVKARKILEKLKEKHYEEYHLEALREDQKLIDEMAGVAFYRQDNDS
ncbi:MAG TPA: flagellar export protein FliJ [Bacillota bacterium]|nr:flagellar export protein FliJ [Bacillota bacterium]